MDKLLFIRYLDVLIRKHIRYAKDYYNHNDMIMYHRHKSIYEIVTEIKVNFTNDSHTFEQYVIMLEKTEELQ